jgi:hypothetical protein
MNTKTLAYKKVVSFTIGIFFARGDVVVERNHFHLFES